MSEETIKTVKRVFLFAVLLLTAVIVISAAQKKKSKNAMDILIDIQDLQQGNSFVSREDIILTIERSFGHVLAGVPIGALNVERVERVLESDPFIRNADVYINAKDIVHINIQQREPILRIIDRNGLSYYLDAEGNKMPLSKHFTARVLVASGNVPPFVPDFLERKEHVIKDLFLLTKRILQDKELLNPLVEQIYVDEQKEFTLIPKVGRQKILLGKLEDVEDKIFKLKTFYREAMPYAGWDRYRAINLKYKGQVVGEKS